MGKIKKILENELIGGAQTTDVYPVTSTKAVYDVNNKRLDEILSASTEAINGVTNTVTDLEQRIGDIKIDKSLNTDSVQKLCDVNIKSGQEFSFVVDGAFSANRIMLAADNSLSNRIQDYIVKGKLYTIVAQFDITEIYGFFSGDFSPSDFSLHIYTNISEAVRSLVGEADNNKRTSRYVGNSYKCFVGIGNNNAEEILEGINDGQLKPSDFYKCFQYLKISSSVYVDNLAINIVRYNYNNTCAFYFVQYKDGTWEAFDVLVIGMAEITNPNGVSVISKKTENNLAKIDAVIDFSLINKDGTSVQFTEHNYVVSPNCIVISEEQADVEHITNFKVVKLERTGEYYTETGSIGHSDARFSIVNIKREDFIEPYLSLSEATRGKSDISSAVFLSANGSVLGTINENFHVLYASQVPSGTDIIGFTFMFDESLGEMYCTITGVKRNIYEEEFEKTINPYLGKVGVVFGDSIINGVGALVGQECTQKMQHVLGCKIYNGGIGGWKMTDFCNIVDGIVDDNWEVVDADINYKVQTYPSDVFLVLPSRFAEIKALDFSKVDFVVIAYGANDWTANTIRDNQSNKMDKTTILGAMRSSISRLLSAFPNLEVMVVTPSYRCEWDASKVITNDSDNAMWNGTSLLSSLGALATEIETCAKELKVKCWQQYESNGVNKYNAQKWLDDGTHRTAEGYELLGKQLAAFVNR